MTPAARLGSGQLLRYGALALPLAFAGLPIYVHAPELYASDLGVPLTTLGLALLALRLVDALQDPLIGSLGDRWHRRRPAQILAGMALLAGGFWLLFHPLASLALASFCVGILACTTGFSIVSINYLALGGLWRAGGGEATRIAGWREGLGLVGLLLATIAPTLLGAEKDALGAFHELSLIYLPLLALGALVFFSWLGTTATSLPPRRGRASFAAIYDRWSARFFALYFGNALASSIPAVLVIFFINDRIQTPGLTGLFLLLYFLSGAAAMPLWQRLAARRGGLRAWLFGMWLAVITFLGAGALGAGDALPYALVCLASGLALGADLALPPAIIAQRIARRGHEPLATRYFALMTFLSKAALALAAGIALPALGLAGYEPGARDAYAATQSLSLAYALIPCALKALVALALWRFIAAGEQRESTHEKSTSRNPNHEHARHP